MDSYTLHSQIAQVSLFVKDLALSRLVLMNDARFPWVLLVPRREGVRELIDLLPGDQQMFLQEINSVSVFMKRYFSAQNLNIGALGNVVPVLHMHIIARYETDSAWPKPVWGSGAAEPYNTDAANKIIAAMAEAMGAADR